MRYKIVFIKCYLLLHFCLLSNKKLILGVTIVYDFLASTPIPRTPHNSLRAGPNVKTKDDRTDKLIYDIASGFEGTDDGSAVRPCQNKTLSTWIN